MRKSEKQKKRKIEKEKMEMRNGKGGKINGMGRSKM